MSSPPYRAPPPPPPVAAPDEAARLGRLRSVHRPAKRGPLFLLAFLFVAVFGAVAAAPGLQHPSTLRADALIPLAVALVIGVLCAVVAALWRAPPVEAHEGGLVVQRRSGREVILFDEVDEVWFEQTWVRTWPTSFAQIHAMRLVDRDGKKHRLSIGVDDAIGLLRWTLRHCSDPLLPEARAALAAGETLRFGKIQLDREGITVGRARSAWRDIRFARAHLGSLSLFRSWPIFAWRTIGMDAVPHPLVFSRLVIERVGRVEQDYPPGTVIE